MNNNVEKFLNEVFGEVRVIKEGNEIWFCASDVANILNYSSTRKLTDKIDDEDIFEISKSQLSSYEGWFTNQTGGQPVKFINKSGCWSGINSCRKISKKNKYEIYKKITGEDAPNAFLTIKESEFISKLLKSLEPFNMSGVCQYKVLKYRIDLYLPSLNIAIEYDERNHNGYTYNQHIGREKEIKKELGCRFIRISDEYSDEYNIGYVIKEIFDIK